MMHDVLRARLLRKIESLPEEQVYQVLDFIEFLEAKYARDVSAEASGLQGFAEKLEDQLRRRAVSPASLREAFQLISAADRVLSNVTKVGKDLLGDLNGGMEAGEPVESEKKSPPSATARNEKSAGSSRNPPPGARKGK